MKLDKKVTIKKIGKKNQEQEFDDLNESVLSNIKPLKAERKMSDDSINKFNQTQNIDEDFRKLALCVDDSMLSNDVELFEQQSEVFLT